MQIVIDIDEAVYKECMPYKDTPIISNLANCNSEIIHAIANGIPLPKGHGRLIDADALVSEIKNLKKSPWYKDNTNLSYLPRKEAVEIIEIIIIEDAPTIIEADKEGSGDA